METISNFKQDVAKQPLEFISDEDRQHLAAVIAQYLGGEAQEPSCDFDDDGEFDLEFWVPRGDSDRGCVNLVGNVNVFVLGGIFVNSPGECEDIEVSGDDRAKQALGGDYEKLRDRIRQEWESR